MSRSSFRRGILAALTVATVLPAVSHAQQFEGVISMRIKGPGQGGQPGQMVDAEYLASRTGRVRLNMPSQMGTVGLIMLPADRKMLIVLDAQSMYMEADMGDVGPKGASDSVKVVHTGKKETIAGYECEHVTVGTGNDQTDVCIAKGLGNYQFVGGGMMRQNTPVPAWQRAMLSEGAFPLKATAPDGSVPYEVTKIEKKVLESTLFDAPSNYQKMQMPGRGGF